MIAPLSFALFALLQAAADAKGDLREAICGEWGCPNYNITNFKANVDNDLGKCT